MWTLRGGRRRRAVVAVHRGIRRPAVTGIGVGHGRASAKGEYLVIGGTEKIGGMVELTVSHMEFMLRLVACPLGSRRTACVPGARARGRKDFAKPIRKMPVTFSGRLSNW